MRDRALPARDGRLLAATTFSSGRPHAPLVVLAGATGVGRGFYAPFASHLAEQGFDVVTFDYRGIGGSVAGHPRDDPATMRQWGERDLAGVLAWARGQRPSRLLLVGHSVGGQVFPLASNAGTVDAAFFVGAQLGHHAHWRGMDRAKVLAFWYALLPAALAATGHCPGALLGGEPLPPGVAREWRRWCTTPGYLLGVIGEEAGRRFASIRIPLAVARVRSDFFAPPPAVDALAEAYSGADITRLTLPAQHAGHSVGHFGFFRKRSAALWSTATRFLIAQAARGWDDPDAAHVA